MLTQHKCGTEPQHNAHVDVDKDEPNRSRSPGMCVRSCAFGNMSDSPTRAATCCNSRRHAVTVVRIKGALFGFPSLHRRAMVSSWATSP